MTDLEAIVLALVIGGAGINLIIQFVRGEPRTPAERPGKGRHR